MACANHPDRRAGVSCQRCDRPICPDCMVTASVGFHCPQCAQQGRQQVHTRRTLAAARRPDVTRAIIAANLVAYLVVAVDAGSLWDPRGQLFIDHALLGLGAVSQFQLIGVDTGEWSRLLTGGFLHVNPLHLGMNMYLVYLLGGILEPAFGKPRFALLYLVTLLTGSLGVMLVDPNALTVGASGAGFGLMGVMLIAQRASGVDPWRSGIGGLVLLNLLITFTIPNISIGGHIGGLLGGFAVGALLVELPRRAAPGPGRSQALWVGTVLVAALGVASVVVSVWASGQIPSVL